ncbi:MAG: 16S rRNA (adenine(1518)-N(6)/adenine(1519)-N(6))-dimethyltransferase RsmA [Bacillota bacterium]
MVAEPPNLTSPRVLMELFKRYGLTPNRYLGQNFLVDGNIVRKIVKAVEVKSGDSIIEVGAGAGALTVALAQPGVELNVLEVDNGLVKLLKDMLPQRPSIKLHHEDALKVKWRDITGIGDPGKSCKLVSNLPYNISGPFMYNLFNEGFPFERAILMFQKEVAMRLLADPGDNDYGSLSVLCRYYTEGKLLFQVSKNVFWPRPKVGSAVIDLRPRSRELSTAEESLFWELVQGVFRQRRKTILNSLFHAFSYSRSELSGILEKASIDPAVRPEELAVEQFAKLARITYNYFSKNS